MIAGNEIGIVFNGNNYFEGAITSQITGGDYQLFGKTYAFDPSGGWITYSVSVDEYGNRTLHPQASERYASPDGGYLMVQIDTFNYPWVGPFSGFDAQAGSFVGTYQYWHTLNFSSRSSPSFAIGRTTLWVGDVPLLFQSGTLEADGSVVDTYSDADSYLTLKISGNIVNGMSPTSVILLAGGTESTQGTFTAPGTFTMQNGSMIDTTHEMRTTPYFTGTNAIWVDGSKFDFVSGLDTSSLGSRDIYENPSIGSVTITAGSPAAVSYLQYSIAGPPITGSYDATNSFVINGATIRTTPPPLTPPAFWLAGVLYSQTSDTSYAGPAAEVLNLSSAEGSATVSGNDVVASFTGTYANDGKVFTVTFTGGTVCIAYPANADGSIWHSNAGLPSGLPPAVVLPGGERIWQFLSTAPDETDPSQTSAYYGNAAARTASGNYADHSSLLKIRADGTVILSDYANWQDFVGTYDEQLHLFQSSRDQRLPMPLFCVSPANNNMPWGQLTPSGSLPITVLVGGEVWRYTGDDSNGAAIYQGYYAGQQMVLTPNLDGSYAVNLVDIYGGNASGTYRNGTFQVVGRKVVGSDGQGKLLSGLAGVTSISGDLDILGNVVTLGSLKSDVNATGVTFTFTDDGSTASLISGLNRPVAEWVWNRAGATPDTPIAPMMKLDAGHRLQLFSPAEPTTPAIVLDPAGGSRINGNLSIDGTVRIKPAGDLGMGEFTSSPPTSGN